MQFLQMLLHKIVKWITDIILLIITELSKWPLLGEKGAIILVYGTFVLALISFGVLCVLFFIDKKYKASIYFLIAVVFMVGYLITLACNIGSKAN